MLVDPKRWYLVSARHDRMAMNAFDVHAKVREVIARKDDEWDREGDAWLAHPNPDESYLLVDELADAVYSALIAEAKL